MDEPRERTGHALSQKHGDPKAALRLLLNQEEKNDECNN
jgi:hypothetical protein